MNISISYFKLAPIILMYIFKISYATPVLEKSHLKSISNGYKNIRFIAYSIPTLPNNLVPIGDIKGSGAIYGDYNGGSINTVVDLIDRANILLHAVDTANKVILKNGSSSDDVINVFMAPEFFFHGINGPYIYYSGFDTDPLTFIQNYLYKHLKSYKNWIIIAGSILTFDARENMNKIFSRYSNVNENVNLMYNAFIKHASISDVLSTNNITKSIEKYIQTIHDDGNISIKNRTIVINNIGPDSLNYREISVQKKYFSNADLPISSSNNTLITNQMSKYPYINLSTGDIKKKPNDPYSIFSVGLSDNVAIGFGVESCLDHSRGRLRYHRNINSIQSINNAMNKVHIQLVPSCGMQIKKGSVIADHNGFIFNVDGGYQLDQNTHTNCLSQNYEGKSINLPYKSRLHPDGKFTYGAHSQLAIVDHPSHGVIPGVDNALFYNKKSSKLTGIDMFHEKISRKNIDFNVDRYFYGGSGEIEIYGLKHPSEIW